ncbi:hypothetical protein KSZ_48510 [Dictyobacter formicarum]|uniref:Uncharacterized protein n=1 Tax=Dictyobacter formicarum TaxID=2778368 RepID=A0ABQ3VL76_9CHLR|nr:hypothetical protein KSZ_48510 [Dictyobacter formicarum]
MNLPSIGSGLAPDFSPEVRKRSPVDSGLAPDFSPEARKRSPVDSGLAPDFSPEARKDPGKYPGLEQVCECRQYYIGG